MEISDVRVRLVEDANERLKAVCSITLDDQFVVRDVKIVDGTHGLFVAMPSRKLTVPCSKCRTQNHVRARCCNECGSRLPPARVPVDENGREKAHRDVAHPITAEFRKTLQDSVLAAFEAEAGNVGESQAEAGQVEAEEPVEERVEEEAVGKRHAVPKAEQGDDSFGADLDQKDDAPAEQVFGKAHDDDDDEDDDDGDTVDGEDNSAAEYDSLIAGLKGGRDGGGAPAGRGARPDQGRSRGGRQGGRRPAAASAPATAPVSTRREDVERPEKSEGEQRGGRRGGRGGRGRGGRDEQRPAASQDGGAPTAVVKEQPAPKPAPKPAVSSAGFAQDAAPADSEAFGAGTAPKPVATPPRSRSESTGGRGRGRGGSKPQNETRSREAAPPPPPPVEPTPAPQPAKAVDDDGAGAFGTGIG